MKLLIVSDLHANPQGIRAIWEKEKDADAIYAAGDYSDYGPDPVAAIGWIRDHGVHAVYGNHDKRVIKTYREGSYHDVPKDRYSWVHYNCQVMGESDVAFLESLPQHICFEADGIAYMIQHQYGPRYEIIESQYHFDKYWAENYTGPTRPGQERRMIFGHTHRQMIMQFANGLWLNPGSASYRRPDEPSKDAFYAVIKNGVISLRHTPYDAAPLNAVVEQLKPVMWDAEYHVAHYFFGMTEADGPDDAWMEMAKAHFSKENHKPME